MKETMGSKDFNKRLVEDIPEVRPAYRKEKKDFWKDEEPGSTIVVEDYLMPFVYSALEKKDDKLLGEFRDWLEGICSLQDEFCDEVIFVSIFEKAYYEGKIRLLASNAFGPKAMDFYSKTSFASRKK